MLQALQQYWDRRAHTDEFLGWVERALAHVGHEAKPIQIWAWRRGVLLALKQGNYDRAAACVAQALVLAREVKDKWEITQVLNLQSQVALMKGDYAAARAILEEVLVTCRELGKELMAAATLISLGSVDLYEGKYAHAEILFTQSLKEFQTISNKTGITWALLNLGDTARYLGRFAEAQTNLLQALALAADTENARMAAETLVVMGNVIMDEAKAAKTAPSAQALEQVARLSGLASALIEGTGGQLEPVLKANFDSHVSTARDTLGDTAFTEAWEEGLNSTLEQAVQIASLPYEHAIHAIPPRVAQDRGGLTAREYEIAVLVSQGMTNAEIAEQLVLSERTVEMHVSHALRKLGLTSRTELAVWANQRAR